MGRLEDLRINAYLSEVARGYMVGRAGGHDNQIDVPLVEHVGKAAEHAAVGEIAGYAVAALLEDVAGRDHAEKPGVRLQQRAVLLEHDAAEAGQGHAHGRALVVFAVHFLTISVIADRNCATSVNCLYTLANLT